MPSVPRWLAAVGWAAVVGCAVAPSPVPPGSLAETQLHAACPTVGGCVLPLTCVGGEESAEPSTCELSCTGVCPFPQQCMPRVDGQPGGVCNAPPVPDHPWGVSPFGG